MKSANATSMAKELKRAITAVGGLTDMARILKLSTQAVFQWTAAPPARVLAIEAACNGIVSRHNLRPDIFGPPDEGARIVKNPTIDINVPNRLLECPIRVLSVAPSHLGVIEMETDQGFIPISINRKMAALLITELANFMVAEEVDPVEYAANDE